MVSYDISLSDNCTRKAYGFMESYPGERMDEGTRQFLIQERETCIPWCALRLQKEQELRDWETLEYMTQFDPFFCSKECMQEWL